MRTIGKGTTVILSVFAVVGLLGLSDSQAQTSFPAKPISMIVPFAAGGAVDTTIRIISEEAEKGFGQKILVINKPGAGAAEGQGFVARSKPDGYTLLAMTSSVVTNTLTKKVDFTIDSFTPIVLYCFDPEVMFVSSTTPYQTLEDLINAGKKEPISHATPGHSTSHHVAALILEKKTGMKFKFVHTKGGGEQIPMVAGGHAKCMLASWGEGGAWRNRGNSGSWGSWRTKETRACRTSRPSRRRGSSSNTGRGGELPGPRGFLRRLSRSSSGSLEAPWIRKR